MTNDHFILIFHLSNAGTFANLTVQIAKIPELIALPAGGKRSEKSDLLGDMTTRNRLLLTKAAILAVSAVLRLCHFGNHKSSMVLKHHQEGDFDAQTESEVKANNSSLAPKY